MESQGQSVLEEGRREGVKTDDGAFRDGERTFWFFFWYDMVRYFVMRMAWRGLVEGGKVFCGRVVRGVGCAHRESATGTQVSGGEDRM